MSSFALFVIGTVVFFFGATGLVLYGLNTFQIWSEFSAPPGDDDPLEADGTARKGPGSSSR